MVTMGISLSVAHDDADPAGARTVRGARTDHTTDDHPTTGATTTAGFLRPGSDDLATHWVERTKAPPAGGDRRRRVRRGVGGAGREHHRHRAPADEGGAVRRPRPVGRVHQPLAGRAPRRLLEPRDQRRHVHGQHAARDRAARAGRRRAACCCTAGGRRCSSSAHWASSSRSSWSANTLVDRPRPDVPRLDSTPSTSSFPSGHIAATPRALVRHGADRERHRPQPGRADRRVDGRHRW